MKSSEELQTRIERLEAAFDRALHCFREAGANVRVCIAEPVLATDIERSDALLQAAAYLDRFLSEVPDDVFPLLAEDSDGWQGYSNPFSLRAGEKPGTLTLRIRLRDFDRSVLDRREAHIVKTAASVGLPPAAMSIIQQYADIGPELAQFPELVSWAETALTALGLSARHQPIRGGTGVGPFLAARIPVANLGTGYWGLETEREFTTIEMLAAHVLWFVNLVQVFERP